MFGMPTRTKTAAYRYEIRRLHGRSDDLCVAVSALLRHIICCGVNTKRSSVECWG